MRYPEAVSRDRRAYRSYRVMAGAGIRSAAVQAGHRRKQTGAFPPPLSRVNSSGNPELAPCAGLVNFRVGKIAGVVSLARDFSRPSMRINA